jgi:hypothetical protein
LDVDAALEIGAAGLWSAETALQKKNILVFL